MTLCQPMSSFKNFKMVSLILYITICGSFILTCLLDIYSTLKSICSLCEKNHLLTLSITESVSHITLNCLYIPKVKIIIKKKILI